MVGGCGDVWKILFSVNWMLPLLFNDDTFGEEWFYLFVSQGGGVKRLFRKVDNKSSQYDQDHPGKVRRDGSYLIEEFLPTGGTDVKVRTILLIFRLMTLTILHQTGMMFFLNPLYCFLFAPAGLHCGATLCSCRSKEVSGGRREGSKDI